MTIRIDWAAALSVFVVALCWLGFGVVLIVGSKGAGTSTRKRDFKSHTGFLLQILGYAICFCWSRTYFSPLAPMSEAVESTIAAFAAMTAIASTWFCFSAARALGRQWALVARVIEGHELIQQGPYATVRNPIYLAMLGMLFATGLVISHWEALAGATVVFVIGTEIRIRSEEKLLREAFGMQFDQYTREVPALVPRLF
jgi:protein-S-isoprenylcysteine O-methyltransferase Ste14